MTGTGTEVGKTIVAGVVARSAHSAGHRVSVFKPAVSGLDELGGGPADHDHLRRAAASDQGEDEIAPYRYGPAVSPHLAAAMMGEEIDADLLRGGLERARAGGDYLVCEGVGGLLVPLRSDYLVRDFACDAGLPLVVVAPPSLGTINHTLLTVETARAAGLEVATVVLTPWPDDPNAVEDSNRETIAALAGVPVLTLARIDPGAPADWPTLPIGPSEHRGSVVSDRDGV